MQPDNAALEPDPAARALKLMPFLLETITILDENGKARWSSGEPVGRLGYEPGTVVARATWDLVHPDDVERLAQRFVDLLQHPGDVQADEFRLRAADGSWQWVEAEARNLLDDPDVQGVVLATRNVTARYQALDALRQSEERFKALVQHSTDLIVVFDERALPVYLSPSVFRVFGVTQEELVGASIVDLVHPDDRARLRDALETARARPGHAWLMHLRVPRRDGTVRELEASLRNLLDDPSVRGFVLNARDITERRQSEATLAYQALHDPLTALPNRTLLLDRVQQALHNRDRSGRRLLMLFLDLDRFKVINDSIGHSVGDELLQEVGRRLSNTVRDGDTVARLGGDEFVVLCPDYDPAAQPGELAERILDAVARPMDLGGRPVVVTASVGVVLADRTHLAPEDLLRDADTAMYRAKELGKDRFAVFDDGLRARSIGRLTVESELRRALEHDEFELYYQPQVDLRTGAVVDVEALLRWRAGTRELRTPSSFLDVAEETGILRDIGAWSLAEAARAAARWPGVRVWLNLSPRQLTDVRLPAAVRASIDEHRLAPGALGVEITEHALVRDTDAAVHALERLKQIGVATALDDFGTGYSSLAYLRSFPVDTVKIDQSFVAGLGEERWAEAIVTAVVAMAHALELTVVAEGIEHEHQLDRLRDLGVDLGQGFLLGAPSPAAALDHRLRPGTGSAAAS